MIHATGASLTLSPNQGQFSVGSTFQVSIILNTGSQAVNAVNVHVSFPPDKLQVVNPTISQSFIQIWTNGPSYSNTAGTLTFQGGLPSPGITTSSGVVSTIEFRATAVGTATLSFSGDSQVLANDGNGTNILTSKSAGSYLIQLPSPAGPTVTSSTHPDQNAWYPSRNLTISWTSADGAKTFSQVLDTNPYTVPDTTNPTTDTQLTTTVKADGIWYFHVRAQSSGGWGGATTYSAKIDATAPAGFTPVLAASTFSRSTPTLARFTTTDATSGIDHYELKVIDISNQNGETTFYTEQKSPYQLPDLTAGHYQLIVRAVDLAGNTTDGVVPFTVVSGSAAFGFGAPFFSSPLANNFIIGALLLVTITLLIGWWRRRRRLHSAKRLQESLIELRQITAEKQAELNRLLSLQAETQAELRRLPSVTSAERLNGGQNLPRQEFQGGPAAGGNETNLTG